MSKIVRNTLLNYLPKNFTSEKIVNPARIFEINEKPLQNGDIVYLCEREIRAKDNFALQFALQKSSELNLHLKIIHPKTNYEHQPKNNFINTQISQTAELFKTTGHDFEITDKNPYDILKSLEIALLIIDFNPILNRDYLKNFDFKILEIDGHNIVPARFVSDKQEYGAVTIRRKIYKSIYPFLTEFENLTHEKTEADYAIEDFIKNKLDNYAEQRNEPSLDMSSGLSKYLNLGFLSSQRIALEVIRSDADIINKEAFLEELIIRKELADNFCLYGTNFKSFSDIPNWVKISLRAHSKDIRGYIYSSKDLENAKTHDKLWNAAQNQLLKTGTIHGYLRMYWAKKIPEWTPEPAKALETVIYLNDKYAYDAPSANGYTAILWALGGLHDRAFSDFYVTGKIRRMTYDSIKRKHDLSGYLARFS